MNIGGGRVVLQDLPRIDRAIEDGTLAQQPGAGRHHRQAEIQRRSVPPHGPALAGRGAFPPGAYGRARQPRSPPPACRCACTPSSTGATRRRRARRGYLERFLADIAAAGPQSPSRRSPAATTRWTATSAGSASRSPAARWSMPQGERARERAGGGGRRLCARRDRRVREADRPRRLCRA